jgi:uncharacterized protein (DUF58 family)
MDTRPQPEWQRAIPGRLLDPQVLGRIQDLELVARTVVEGFIGGLHRSPYLGLSVDFAEHRAYMPGDDIRRIDWRVFARTDRHYVKEFEADSNTNFTLVLDVSRSMGFASGGTSKLDYGRILCACLAYFAHKQRDRVGLFTFDHEVVEHVPCSARHLDAVLHTLERAGVGGRGELTAPLTRVAEASRRRGLLVLVSDLYEEPEAVLAAARKLGYRGSDVIVFHLLDPAEIHFPYEEAATYRDLETGAALPVVPEYVREQYRRLVAEHTESLARLLGGDGMDYALLDTSAPLDAALFRYLSRREHRRRIRR